MSSESQPGGRGPAATVHATPAPRRGNWLLLGGAAIVLAAALGFAATRGDNPAAPAAAPSATAAAATGDIAALEARVAADPRDLDAWTRLAEARYDADDYRGAADAYRKAVDLAPAAAGLWSALGEAIVLATPAEAMPAAALDAFRRANGLDAKDPRARYFLAVKKDLDDDHEGAIRDWLALLADTPPGAPWEANLRKTIEEVGQMNNIAVAPRLAAVRQRPLAANELPTVARAIPGPTREQMAAAAALPKGQQDMMVQGMVDSLQAKLDENPRQPDRWLMLIRSRMTLGQAAQASAALQAAVRANPADAPRLRAQARLLGVPGA